MKTKLKPKNRKWIIPTLVALTGIGCVSIGFCSWNVMGGVNAYIDDYIEAEALEIKKEEIGGGFTFSDLSAPIYNSSKGFVNQNGKFTAENNFSFSITGKVKFSPSGLYEKYALHKNSIKIRLLLSYNVSNIYIDLSQTSSYVYMTESTLSIDETNLTALDTIKTYSSITESNVEILKTGKCFPYSVANTTTTYTFNFSFNLICPTFANYNANGTYHVYAYAEDN